MKLEGKITVLISRDETKIMVKDPIANVTFLTVILTPEQLSEALSRQSHTDCEIEVFGLDKIGKKHENKTFEFEIPCELASSKHEEELRKIAQRQLVDGWTAQGYFGSQDSFFKKGDGKCYARCTIRKWS
jgi:hypothetical protein